MREYKCEPPARLPKALARILPEVYADELMWRDSMREVRTTRRQKQSGS